MVALGDNSYGQNNNAYEDPEPSESGDFNSPGDQTPPDPSNEWIPPGDVGKPPPVPGGSDTPGKGVTAVNTEAMRTFAKNLETLADGPIKDLEHKLDGVQLKPGIFLTANEKIFQPILGSNALRDTSKTAIHDLVRALGDMSEAVNTAAKAYENADEVNKMTADEYNEYFNEVNGQITNAGQKH
ncbi:WXG100 family type VII secretion target [Amycolatopsis jiangsuensis]|uniref:Uncharacterized protein n=1 Tax=Amycolatopsis jiangsuensis TaxID=1181879 RepID=A0A840J0Y2_9PSEU|nr:hypothetical protein [Amycolatopsis jiangsuensis]MBB4687593.1 hypothetical protein [Amycolatopsis jiangsuensis]